MKLLLVLILLIYQQNNATAQSLSEMIHLYHYAEDQIKEIHSMVQTLMENVAVQQKKIISEMYGKCTDYINTGLKSLVNSDDIQNRINECFVEVNSTIDATVEQYHQLYDESAHMLATTVEKLHKEPVGDDLDEINDEIDDIIDDFKEKLDVEINEAVESLLRRMRTTSVSLPIKVKKCVDDLLSLM